MELIVALGLTTVLFVAAVTTLRSYLDRLAVRHATITLHGAFARARRAGIHYGGATIHLTLTSARITTRDSTLVTHEFLRDHRVTLRTTTAAMSFGATGLGRGIANGTIILERGRAADTLVVSRLGRVRQ